MGKGRKRLQTTNQEIELLQQHLDNALEEIYMLQKQNQSIIGKVAKFRTQDNELYHEFVSSATQCINALKKIKITRSYCGWYFQNSRSNGNIKFKIESLQHKLLET